MGPFPGESLFSPRGQSAFEAFGLRSSLDNVFAKERRESALAGLS
jgi:hypothetical protein